MAHTILSFTLILTIVLTGCMKPKCGVVNSFDRDTDDAAAMREQGGRGFLVWWLNEKPLPNVESVRRQVGCPVHISFAPPTAMMPNTPITLTTAYHCFRDFLSNTDFTSNVDLNDSKLFLSRKDGKFLEVPINQDTKNDFMVTYQGEDDSLPQSMGLGLFKDSLFKNNEACSRYSKNADTENTENNDTEDKLKACEKWLDVGTSTNPYDKNENYCVVAAKSYQPQHNESDSEILYSCLRAENLVTIQYDLAKNYQDELVGASVFDSTTDSQVMSLKNSVLKLIAKLIAQEKDRLAMIILSSKTRSHFKNFMRNASGKGVKTYALTLNNDVSAPLHIEEITDINTESVAAVHHIFDQKSGDINKPLEKGSLLLMGGYVLASVHSQVKSVGFEEVKQPNLTLSFPDESVVRWTATSNNESATTEVSAPKPGDEDFIGPVQPPSGGTSPDGDTGSPDTDGDTGSTGTNQEDPCIALPNSQECRCSKSPEDEGCPCNYSSNQSSSSRCRHNNTFCPRNKIYDTARRTCVTGNSLDGEVEDRRSGYEEEPNPTLNPTVNPECAP
ncbi:MAG: hypothetical protein OXC40_00125 [Proteobacteria bacterium]|nr:hypothetical protein [Pseudomonadota bacterium]